MGQVLFFSAVYAAIAFVFKTILHHKNCVQTNKPNKIAEGASHPLEDDSTTRTRSVISHLSNMSVPNFTGVPSHQTQLVSLQKHSSSRQGVPVGAALGSRVGE
jgi:hypothetical protein